MKPTKHILATIAMLLCSIAASAHDFEVGGIYYNITSEEDLTVEVTYQGSYSSEYNEYSEAVIIPATVTHNGVTYNVTSIGDEAFYGCESLTAITIPESVTSIGDYAFYRCSSLTSITIPEGVTILKTYAFQFCSSLESVELPNSLQEIALAAFSHCPALVDVELPEGLTIIGDYALQDCGFSSIVIPEGVTSIGDYAFSSCSSLTSITIPEDVTSIGNSAFYGCSSLTAINIPGSVTSIGDQAFYGCSSLTTITIPEGVTSIGSGAFANCSSLTAITVDENNTVYDSRNNCNAIIETAGNILIAGCSTTVIPESVTSIGNSAFYGCSSLTSITIPESVKSIGDYAFSGCQFLEENFVNNSFCSSWGNWGATLLDGEEIDGLFILDNVVIDCRPYVTSITIPEGVTRIGEYAFSRCSSLTAINIPEGVTSIEDYAFSSCSSLTAINIPEGVTSIGNSAFYGCSSLTTITIPESVTSIGDQAFYGCRSLTAITIPEGVTSIGDYAFEECSSLTAINIPEGVTSIGYRAFENCSSLTNITVAEENTKYDSRGGCNAIIETNSNTLIQGCSTTIIPEGVTRIGEYAFSRCSSLTAINIPEGVTSIEDYAFSSCSSLTAITIPESVTSIGFCAFWYCSNLKSIYCYAQSVPATDGSVFTSFSATLYVPSSAMASYQSTAPWSSFGKFEAFNIAVSEIVLSQTEAILVDEELISLTAIVSPKNARDMSISWSSSNPSVASVDTDGVVTALAMGTAIITATANDGSGVSASCEVVVVKEKAYGAIFMVDGEVYHTNSPKDYAYPEAPEKAGFTFVGWEKEDDIVLTDIDIKNNADTMLYTNAPCTNTTYGDQFVGWHVLFDGDANTFFHSEYSNIESADGLDHYLRVDMGEGKAINNFTFSFTVRGNQSSCTPTKIVVEGSNKANGAYTEIATLTDLPRENGAVYESAILNNGNPYRYIRYRVIETVYNYKVKNHPYFYIAEFEMKSVSDVYRAVYVSNDDVDTGVEQMTIDNPEVTIYDLSGRRVVHPTKGVYIVNGRKVIVND